MKTLITCLSLSAFVLFLAGCNSRSTQRVNTNGSDTANVIDQTTPATDGHGHPDHGPHGGELIELGKEDFHLELVHKPETVTFYVLDGAAADAVAIETPLVTVSLKHDGQVELFELNAQPLPEDGEGRSSRFASNDPQFASWMDQQAEGAVTVQIQGKSYTGKVSHDHAGHDHDGHAH